MIRYYEYENDELYHLSEFKSIDPQRGKYYELSLSLVAHLLVA
jgi:hypothetical protein